MFVCNILNPFFFFCPSFILCAALWQQRPCFNPLTVTDAWEGLNVKQMYLSTFSSRPCAPSYLFFLWWILMFWHFEGFEETVCLCLHAERWQGWKPVIVFVRNGCSCGEFTCRVTEFICESGKKTLFCWQAEWNYETLRRPADEQRDIYHRQ